MMKGSERALDKDADKKQIYSKRTFYLSKDVLYYISKDSTMLEQLISSDRISRGQRYSAATREDLG